MPVGFWVIMGMKDFLLYGTQFLAQYRADIIYNKGTNK